MTGLSAPGALVEWAWRLATVVVAGVTTAQRSHGGVMAEAVVADAGALGRTGAGEAARTAGLAAVCTGSVGWRSHGQVVQMLTVTDGLGEGRRSGVSLSICCQGGWERTLRDVGLGYVGEDEKGPVAARG